MLWRQSNRRRSKATLKATLKPMWWPFTSSVCLESIVFPKLLIRLHFNCMLALGYRARPLRRGSEGPAWECYLDEGIRSTLQACVCRTLILAKRGRAWMLGQQATSPLAKVPPHIYIYIYIYVCIHTYIHIYIYIYICIICAYIIYTTYNVYIYVYIYIYIYTHTYVPRTLAPPSAYQGARHITRPSGSDNDRPRENTVGVNMVLAEYHQNILKQQIATIVITTMFEFDGVLLKPCLLQPCFHVTGTTKVSSLESLGDAREDVWNGASNRAPIAKRARPPILRTRAL